MCIDTPLSSAAMGTASGYGIVRDASGASGNPSSSVADAAFADAETTLATQPPLVAELAAASELIKGASLVTSCAERGAKLAAPPVILMNRKMRSRQRLRRSIFATENRSSKSELVAHTTL